MPPQVISKDKLGEWLDRLAGGRRVIAPAPALDGLVLWAEREEGAAVFLGYHNTDRSPKELFFPQTDTLFRFTVGRGFPSPPSDGGGAVPALGLDEQLPPDEQRVLFGIRPCDARALAVWDAVFGDDERPDPYYLKRRQQTALVGLTCDHPRWSCFCGSLDVVVVGQELAPATDLQVTEIDGRFLAEPNTARGEELIAAAADLFSPAGEAELAAAEKVRQVISQATWPGLEGQRAADETDLSPLTCHLSPDAWDSPVWDELGRRCLGCGVCTYLCPTCHCFDIQDRAVSPSAAPPSAAPPSAAPPSVAATSVAGTTAGAAECGERFRCWDNCQFADFTLEAAGHNPRPGRRERRRQHVLHKFQYFPSRWGFAACVGCGRCVEKCPVNIDIRAVVSELRMKAEA